MNKITKILRLFEPQVKWYKEKKKLENCGDIDGSYIYDTCFDEFNDVSRGEWLEFLEILASEE